MGPACVEDVSGCAAAVEAVVAEELRSHQPDLARVSLCLGRCEAALTSAGAEARGWPAREELEASVADGLAVLEGFAREVGGALEGAKDTREKVKRIADAVWSKLTGAFGKEVLHVQHLSTFIDIIAAAGKGSKGSKRALDCAGVVTTVLITMHRLAAAQEHHADLGRCAMQVSEDHCWITLSPEGGREDSVEITTDNKAKRGMAVSEAAWSGWLYNGGGAAVCWPPARAVAALVVSINTTIGPRTSKDGPDSRELEALQLSLLRAVTTACPSAPYPASAIALAYADECGQEVLLREALGRGDTAEARRIFEQASDVLRGHYGVAVEMTQRPGPGQGRLWYPHSSLFFFLKYRGDFVVDCMDSALETEERLELAWESYQEAFAALGGQQGAASVLRQYRHEKTDEQLCKDVTCLLQNAEDVVRWRSKEQGEALEHADMLLPLLELWDGICCYFSAQAMPSEWISLMLKCAKCFSEEARSAAAGRVDHASAAFGRAKAMWGNLKASQLRAIFESPVADGLGVVEDGVENGGGRSKRARR